MRDSKMDRVKVSRSNMEFGPDYKSCTQCGATVSPEGLGPPGSMWWVYRCPHREHPVPAGPGKYRLVHRDEVPDDMVDEDGYVRPILYVGVDEDDEDDGTWESVDGVKMECVWESHETCDS